MTEATEDPRISPARVKALNVYVTAIIGSSAVAITWCAAFDTFHFTVPFLLFLVGAMALSPRSIPLGGRVEMLASEPFLFATLLAVGPFESVLVAGLCALTFCLLRPRRLPLQRVLFNVSSLCLTMFAAAQVYIALGGQVGARLSLQTSTLPVMGAVLVFFLVNSLTVSTAIGISEAISPLTVVREKFVWSYPSHLASGSVAFIMSVALQRFGALALVLATPPVMLIYYFQRAQKERMEEQEKHLTKVREINADLEIKTSELSMANESLQSANRMKSEFMANMSHELRTPLAAILGFSDLLLNENACRLPGDATNWVRDIRRSGQHLLEMISDILNLSKVAAGQMSFNPEPVEIARLISDAIQTLRPLADRGDLMLCSSVPLLDAECMPMKVRVDAGKIRQVLYNLLSNAIKFTPAGGRVVVMCARSGRDLTISVSDTGIGIAPDHHEHVFGKFMQVDPSMSRRYEGTGLGLALVKEFAEMHGGRVDLESELDEGATFIVTLPDCCLLQSEEQPAPAAASGHEDGAVAAAPVVSDGPPVATSRDAPDKDSSSGSILLIEDNETNQSLVTTLLGSRGYRVDVAPTAEEGIRQAESCSPDLILMDINLPGIDGYEATRILGLNAATRDIPVVALTAHIGDEDEVQAYEAGCADFIRKPIDTVAFFDVVASYMELSRNGRNGETTDDGVSRGTRSPTA